jgi:hypothetical protein
MVELQNINMYLHFALVNVSGCGIINVLSLKCKDTHTAVSEHPTTGLPAWPIFVKKC